MADTNTTDVAHIRHKTATWKNLCFFLLFPRRYTVLMRMVTGTHLTVQSTVQHFLTKRACSARSKVLCSVCFERTPPSGLHLVHN